ncbi:MAG: NAD(P)/FAD-dependent oxidoreductase [Lachnospiraceae bacterium]|nr:NAD(P)/FAD-dependent oxidoreductase [Lachnospiraceae bacterium]
MGKVIVIGGGAAGMMAALAAAEKGCRVCLIEKNEKLGKKLFITGKGRCNVTNAGDMETLFANVRANGKFLYSAFYGYDNRRVMDFLEGAGCRLKTERGDRVFPLSDHSSDVISAFARELKRRGVEILLNTEAKSLILGKDESIVEGVRLSGGRQVHGNMCVVCTGGLSYPSTGSTGDGYGFAKEAGHQVVGQRPGLVPFNVREEWCGRLMGLSLKNVSLRLVCGGRETYQGFGEMLFTHFGVSGPLVLSASSHYESGQGAVLYIDLKPALTAEQLDKRLLRDFDENKNKRFGNALGGLFPMKLIPVMVELSGIRSDKKVNEITKEERRRFGELIKAVPLTVKGLRGYEEAIITRGGVCVKEINPSTMESKKVKGLYFAGEVLDVDALTGGFNLQIAWSTGHLAGSCAGAHSAAEGQPGGAGTSVS